MLVKLLCALILLSSATTVCADLPADAVDRGRMSLAWDARTSGLCEETLRYLADLSPAARDSDDALHLRIDCLLDRGRYGEAVDALSGDAWRSRPEAQALLEETFLEWARSLTSKEEYGALRGALARGRSLLPGSALLRSEEAAARFRSELKAGLDRGLRSVRCADGERVRIGRAVRGKATTRWVKAFPWQGEDSPVPRSVMAEWMGSWAARLGRRGQALWVSSSNAGFDRFVREEARRSKLGVRRIAGGFSLTREGGRVLLDRWEWTHRAASEGLGLRGAAMAAVAQADRDLTNRQALVRWVAENGKDLELREEPEAVRLRNPATGRSYELDLLAWSRSYDPKSKEWTDFWADLTCELERPPKAFQCACGAEALLREALLPPGSCREQDGPVLLEKGTGYELALVAVCPTYERYVTPDLLKEWGVDRRAAAERARADASAAPWDLSFRRGQADGSEYVVLRGEGASSLVLRESALLGALEAVEGAAVRKTSVTAVVPTPTSVVLLKGRTPRKAARKALVDVLLDEARKGTLGERLSYGVPVRLPDRPVGTFRVRTEE